MASLDHCQQISFFVSAFVCTRLKYMETFTAGQESTAVFSLCSMGSAVKWLEINTRKKCGTSHQIFLSRGYYLMSQASMPYSMCWVTLVLGSSGLLKDWLIKGASVKVSHIIHILK